MKLDRSKPYGQVSGPGVKHSFEQDGKLFDHAGEEIGQGKQGKAAKATPPPPEPGDDQVDTQLEG